MRYWDPKPGTLPGTTEMRVLRAVGSLCDARESDPGPCQNEVHAFVCQRGYEAADKTIAEYQALALAREWGWEYSLEYTRRQADAGIPWEERHTYYTDGFTHVTRDGLIEWVKTVRPDWRSSWQPDVTTVWKRLRHLAVRGLVERERVGRRVAYRPTREGRALLKRFYSWDPATVGVGT